MSAEVVTRLRREKVGVDQYGSPVWEDVPTTLAERAGFDPGGSVEPVEVGREAVVTTPKLYFWGAVPDLDRTDRVLVRGKEYEIIADPAEWQHMFSDWTAGTVVELKRGEG